MEELVNVLISTYNGEKYLRQQLDSILAQTYPIQELIVQDDCSTDATLAILQEYEAKVPFIQVIENTHNLGFKLQDRLYAGHSRPDSYF